MSQETAAAADSNSLHQSQSLPLAAINLTTVVADRSRDAERTSTMREDSGYQGSVSGNSSTLTSSQERDVLLEKCSADSDNDPEMTEID
jgi:hypothetical protein